MNNQVLDTNVNNSDHKAIFVKILLSLMIMVSLTIVLLSFIPNKNPYINEVLSFQGDQERGKAIFAVNCAGCHGINGDGDVGPNLHNIAKRRSEISIINQVIGGETPPMPKFQASAEDMADLLSYLQNLYDH